MIPTDRVNLHEFEERCKVAVGRGDFTLLDAACFWLGLAPYDSPSSQGLWLQLTESCENQANLREFLVEENGVRKVVKNPFIPLKCPEDGAYMWGYSGPYEAKEIHDIWFNYIAITYHFQRILRLLREKVKNRDNKLLSVKELKTLAKQIGEKPPFLFTESTVESEINPKTKQALFKIIIILCKKLEIDLNKKGAGTLLENLIEEGVNLDPPIKVSRSAMSNYLSEIRTTMRF